VDSTGLDWTFSLVEPKWTGLDFQSGRVWLDSTGLKIQSSLENFVWWPTKYWVQWNPLESDWKAWKRRQDLTSGFSWSETKGLNITINEVCAWNEYVAVCIVGCVSPGFYWVILEKQGCGTIQVERISALQLYTGNHGETHHERCQCLSPLRSDAWHHCKLCIDRFKQ